MILTRDTPTESRLDYPEDGDQQFLTGWAPTSKATFKDVAESFRLAKQIRAVPMQCWFNCRKAILKHHEYVEASYIEGWAVTGFGLSFEHAWIVHMGIILDPSLPDLNLTYYPGLEFRGRGGIEEFFRTDEGRKCRKSPFFYALGWGGHKSPSFRRCCVQANRPDIY